MMGESCVFSEAMKSKFLVHLDHFINSRIKIDHKIYHFIADSSLKDVILKVGVNLLLCDEFMW